VWCCGAWGAIDVARPLFYSPMKRQTEQPTLIKDIDQVDLS
jgi:hypothetical protein